jgi:hypothetical protein
MKNKPVSHVNPISRVLLGFLFIILSADALAKCREAYPESDVPIIIQGSIVSADNDLESNEHHYIVNVLQQLKGPALASNTLNLSLSFMEKFPRTIRFEQGKEYVIYVYSVDDENNAQLFGKTCGNWGRII